MSNFVLPEHFSEKAHFEGLLTHRKVITKNEDRTFFIQLKFKEPMPFTAGDSLAIYPQNKRDNILAFSQALGLNPHLQLTSSLTVYDYLAKNVCLTKWTSKMSQLVFNEPKLREEFKELPPTDILKQFTYSQKQALEILQILPPQLPRYYSIASSPKQDDTTIDLLVSLNAFIVDGVLQYGLATSFLCLDTPLHTPIQCFIHPAPHFRIPETNHPIIMIGPGTGVAPFRAFIQERDFHNHDKNWLFFGERTKAHDFYFEEELLRYQQMGHLKIELAFSRDQEHKIYVQDLLLARKHEVYGWIQAGALIYICGDAKQMAKGVEQAFISILTEFESLDPKAAQQQIKAWRKEGRYNLDVY